MIDDKFTDAQSHPNPIRLHLFQSLLQQSPSDLESKEGETCQLEADPLLVSELEAQYESLSQRFAEQEQDKKSLAKRKKLVKKADARSSLCLGFEEECHGPAISLSDMHAFVTCFEKVHMAS